MFISFNKSISKKREQIVRVITTYIPAGDSIGTGFFINNNGDLLTCFHVVFGEELRQIRKNNILANINESDEHEKLKAFIKGKLSKIEVELFNGSKIEMEIKDFDEKYDIALLSTKIPSKYKSFKLNFGSKINYGDEVLFAGFPNAVGYRGDQTPFAVTVGMVSTFVETQIGGDKYPHIQINGVNLPGNSGGPLFLKGSNEVVGLINGNQIMGIHGDFKGLDDKPTNLFTVPLGITYATSLSVLKKNTKIF